MKKCWWLLTQIFSTKKNNFTVFFSFFWRNWNWISNRKLVFQQTPALEYNSNNITKSPKANNTSNFYTKSQQISPQNELKITWCPKKNNILISLSPFVCCAFVDEITPFNQSSHNERIQFDDSKTLWFLRTKKWVSYANEEETPWCWNKK